LYKPTVTASLPWWRRLGLAFSVFFRVLFDTRFALSIEQASLERGSSPARSTSTSSDRQKVEPDWAAAERAESISSERASSQPKQPALPSADSGALVLLSLLQAEGRFVDFVQQDIEAFGDGDVGAVARVVHSGCRKVLSSHLRIAAIRGEPEGERVALEPGFDPSRIKLTGNVAGTGRLSGVLRHRGWQATEVHLPTVIDRAGTRVLAPAEVEL
jgi:hypothetical protein